MEKMPEESNKFFYRVLGLLMAIAVLMYRCAGVDLEKNCRDLSAIHGQKYVRYERLYFLGIPYGVQCFAEGTQKNPSIQKWP